MKIWHPNQVPLRDAEREGFDLQPIERMQQMKPTLRCKHQSCRSAAGNRADLASAQASAASCSPQAKWPFIRVL